MIGYGLDKKSQFSIYKDLYKSDPNYSDKDTAKEPKYEKFITQNQFRTDSYMRISIDQVDETIIRILCKLFEQKPKSLEDALRSDKDLDKNFLKIDGFYIGEISNYMNDEITLETWHAEYILCKATGDILQAINSFSKIPEIPIYLIKKHFSEVKEVKRKRNSNPKYLVLDYRDKTLADITESSSLTLSNIIVLCCPPCIPSSKCDELIKEDPEKYKNLCPEGQEGIIDVQKIIDAIEGELDCPSYNDMISVHLTKEKYSFDICQWETDKHDIGYNQYIYRFNPVMLKHLQKKDSNIKIKIIICILTQWIDYIDSIHKKCVGRTNDIISSLDIPGILECIKDVGKMLYGFRDDYANNLEHIFEDSTELYVTVYNFMIEQIKIYILEFDCENTDLKIKEITDLSTNLYNKIYDLKVDINISEAASIILSTILVGNTAAESDKHATIKFAEKARSKRERSLVPYVHVPSLNTTSLAIESIFSSTSDTFSIKPCCLMEIKLPRVESISVDINFWNEYSRQMVDTQLKSYKKTDGILEEMKTYFSENSDAIMKLEILSTGELNYPEDENFNFGFPISMGNTIMGLFYYV